MREYEIKGGVWVFQLKILIFSYRFDDCAPRLVTRGNECFSHFRPGSAL